jgi:hypothetical protein
MAEAKIGDDTGIAALGFDADEVVFALSAAVGNRPLRERHREALSYAHRLLQGLATIDDDEPVGERSLSELRGLLATRYHALHAARDSRQDLRRFRETLVDWDLRVQELLRSEPEVPDPACYEPLLTFFELLSARSLAEVRRATEESEPAWMSSVPTELR